MHEVTSLMQRIAERNGLADDAQLRAIVAAGSIADAPSDQMVIALIGTGEVKAGLTEGKKVLSQGRMDPLAIHMMALGFLLKKKAQAAIDALSAGIESHRDVAFLQTSLSQALAALMDRANTKESHKPELMARTTAAAKLATELDPTDELAHLAMARIQIRAGRNFYAEESAKVVLAIDPKSHEAHQMLGVLAEAREAFDEASAHFVEATRLDEGKESIRSLRRLRKPNWIGGVLLPTIWGSVFAIVSISTRASGRSEIFGLVAATLVVGVVFLVYRLWDRRQSRAALSAEAREVLTTKPPRPTRDR